MRTALRFIVGLLVGTLVIELAFRAAELPLVWRVLPVAAYLPRVPDRDLASTNAPGSSGFWLSGPSSASSGACPGRIPTNENGLAVRAMQI